MSQVLTQPVPIKGLNTSQEPTAFSDAFSPFLKNVYVDLTKVRKRRGISQIGTRALPLSGTGMELITYVDARGSRHEIALTTTSAFRYNSSTDSWDDITPGIQLSNGGTNWTSGAGTNTANTVADPPGNEPGGAAILFDCVADVDSTQLLGYFALSATNVTTYTEIRLWAYSVGQSLSVGSLEVVVTENATGGKGGVEVIATNTSVIPADTWTRVAFTVDMSSIDGALSIAVYSNHATEFDALDLYVDDFRVVLPFTGLSSSLWSHTLATDTSEFSNNGGTALIISNGVDDVQYFEGQSSDRFQVLVHASGISNTDVLAEFWNHLIFLNFNDGTQNVRSLLYSAAGDVDDHSSDNAGANTLTDTIGQILAAVKLGSSLIIYSEDTITVGRYYGGLTLFAFPTLVFGTGIVSTNAVLSIANVHLLLGNDQKTYAYYGDTDLVPIGESIEAGLFSALNISKKIHIVSGQDASKYKAHFFIPRSGESDYASTSYCFTYRRSHLSWEFHDFSKTVKGFGSVQAGFDWYCDEDPMQDVYCDESTLTCDESSGQLGYSLPSFISDAGYVYKLDEASDGKDDDTDISFELWTPEFVVNAEEQIGRWTWFSFQGYSGVVDSTVSIEYSTNRGDTWSGIVDSPVSLNRQWTTHRLPIDVVDRRIMFRFLQTSNKDVQLRGLFKCAVEPQPARD